LNEASKDFLEQVVRDSLVQLGYEVDLRVGYSGYHTDFAAANPKDASRYAANGGIEI